MIARLESASALHRASRMRKLFTIPAKLAYSRWMARSKGRIARKSAKMFWGEEMTVVLPERVSTSIYQYGFLEYELSRAFVHLLKPGMTFFDVGAHFGYFSCLASHLVGPTGAVHSFEPTRSTYEILTANAKTRANVRTNNVAAFSRSTTIQFNDFGIEFSAFNSLAGARIEEADRNKVQAQTYDVQAITLDEYVQKNGVRPDVMKIDAESAEYQILLGMEKILTEMRPIVSIEVGDFHLAGVAKSSEVVDYLVKKGYQPHEWRDGALRLHEVRPDYGFDNILFVHPGRKQPGG